MTSYYSRYLSEDSPVELQGVCLFNLMFLWLSCHSFTCQRNAGCVCVSRGTLRQGTAALIGCRVTSPRAGAPPLPVFPSPDRKCWCDEHEWDGIQPVPFKNFFRSFFPLFFFRLLLCFVSLGDAVWVFGKIHRADYATVVVCSFLISLSVPDLLYSLWEGLWVFCFWFV